MYRAYHICATLAVLILFSICVLFAEEQCQAQQQASSEMTIDKIIDEMQKVYDGMKSISAKLKVETHQLIFDEKSEREGRIFLKKPYEFRWDIEKPYEKRFYLNKERAIEYFPDKKLAKIYNLSHSEEKIGEMGSKTVALAILESPKKLKEYYTITLKGTSTDEKEKKEYYELELVPKDDSVESDYERMIFSVNKKSWLPEKMQAFEGEDAIHYITFYDIKLNEDIKDSVFEFKKTKDMIIDEYPKEDAPEANQDKKD